MLVWVEKIMLDEMLNNLKVNSIFCYHPHLYQMRNRPIVLNFVFGFFLVER